MKTTSRGVCIARKAIDTKTQKGFVVSEKPKGKIRSNHNMKHTQGD